MRQLLWMLMVSMAMMVFTGCEDEGGNDSYCDSTAACENAWEECSNSAEACVVKDGMCNADADCADMADSKTKCEMTSHACYDANNFDCATACTGYLECNDAKDGCQLRDGMCNTDADCTEGNKTECNDSNTCIESDTCVDNATRCSSDGKSVETCASNAWTAVACDADLVCEVEGDAAKCVVDAVTCTDDAKRCNADGQLETCASNAWTAVDCDAGSTCKADGDTFACVVDAFDCDTCVSPQKCNDAQDACIFDCDTCTDGKVCNDAKDACVDPAVFDCDTCLAADNKECNEASDACVCMADYHMDGDACVSDSKMVSCVAPETLTENASAIVVDVEVKWENDAWTTAETCDWKCAPDFTKTGDECVAGYTDPCSVVDACGSNEDCSDVDTDGVAECACSDGFVSVNGACVAFVCEDDTVQCNGTSIELCTENAWVTEVDCADTNATCEATEGGGAECVVAVVCDEGATRCTDDMLSVETCTDNAWATVACATGSSCKASGDGYACVGDSACTGLSVEPISSYYDSTYDDYYLAGDNGLQIELYDETPVGEYDLASAALNDNYASCSQCVVVYDEADNMFFQESGRLNVTAGNLFSSNEVAGNITAVKLVQVTLADPDNEENPDYTSTPVEGGGCFEIQTAAWDTTPQQCTENDVRCSGAVIETCQADGSWAAGTDCSANTDDMTACVDGVCVVPSGCQPSGNNTIDTATTLALDNSTVSGALCSKDVEALGDLYTFTLEAETSLVLNVTAGTGFSYDIYDANSDWLVEVNGDNSYTFTNTSSETASYYLQVNDYYDAGAGDYSFTATTTSYQCTENDVRCSGSVIETCQADGSWAAGTDCADNGDACEAGACIAVTPCQTDEQCTDDTQPICNSVSNICMTMPLSCSDANVDCGANGFCFDGFGAAMCFCGDGEVATSDGVHCEIETCTPDETRCSGDVAQTCQADGVTWVDVDCTANVDGNTVCVEGACANPNACEVEGETVCDGATVRTCTDGLFEDTTDCSANTDGNTICVEGGCAPVGTCTGLSIEPLTADVYNGIYYITNKQDNDVFYLDFNVTTTTGNYDLGSVGVNDNFSTCEQCAYLYNTESEKVFFQESGSLSITNGDGATGSSVGSIATVKLIEATIDPDTNVSTPVVDGSCYEIETAAWDTRVRCTPGETRCTETAVETCAADELTWEETTDCATNADGNTICVEGACANPNACETEGETLCDGSVVRTCTGGLFEDTTDCSANTDGMTECVAGACTAPVVCTGLSVGTLASAYNSDYSYYYLLDDSEIQLQVRLYASTPVGEYDLASEGVNDTWAGCEQCLLAVDTVNDTYYFQSSGTLKVIEGDPGSSLESVGELTSIKLVEVDSDTVPITGGSCLEIETAMWNTMPTCVEGAVRCDGDVIETCDNDNNWVAGTDCSATEGDICVSGACVTPECKEDFDCPTAEDSPTGNTQVCILATGDNFRTCVDAIISPECTENTDCTDDSPLCDQVTKTCRTYAETCDDADCGVGECILEDGYYPYCACPTGTYMSEDQMHCLWAVCDDDGGTNNDVANATPIETLNEFTGTGHICSGEQEYYVINQSLAVGDTFTLTLDNPDFTAYLGVAVDGKYMGYVSVSDAGTLNGEIIDLSGDGIDNPTWIIVVTGPAPVNDDYSFTVVQE